ncbi:MAG: DNA-3-methyladenine glycosylase [Myxococcota bacterium]|nr:DNA-3-methyladenine glycosylase [Myxococcota bacterium]
MSRGDLLQRASLHHDALVSARRLLGMHLVAGEVTLAITEVEAYRGPSDTAAHSAKGRTARTEPMFGPAGHAYVYLCYGIHHMLNIVAGPQGHGVLVRACEPVSGLAQIQARRGGRSGPVLLTGPGKVGQALAIDRSLSGHDVLSPGPLELREGTPPQSVLHGPRVGIGYASPEHQRAPWRLAVAGTRWVSHPKGLEPYTP